MIATVSYRTEFESSYLQTNELHSHRYRLEVTVDGPQRFEDHGRVIEFKQLAQYVKQISYDKQYLFGLNQTDNERSVMEAMRLAGVNIHLFTKELSVEMFAADIAERLQLILNTACPGVRVVEVKLRETNDSFATWHI